MDTRVEQGVQNILALLNRIGMQHKTGHGMLISLRHAQLEAGVGYNLLDQTQTKLSYLTASWITGVRGFCGTSDISLILWRAKTVPLSCDYDAYIMEMAMAQDFTPMQLKDLNLVRIFRLNFT